MKGNANPPRNNTFLLRAFFQRQCRSYDKGIRIKAGLRMCASKGLAFISLPIIIMGKTFKIPPPTIYSFEEMLEIADAMERLWETMDRIKRGEEKKKKGEIEWGKKK